MTVIDPSSMPILNLEDFRKTRITVKFTRRQKASLYAFGLSLLALPFIFMGWMHSFVMWSLFKTAYPWYVDIMAGTLLSPLTVWLTPLCVIYRLGGETIPLIHL